MLIANAGADNAWGVNQEKLDIYRASHPRYNFPVNISDLIEAQSKQILEYFYDNYRFGDYKYDEISEQVWAIFIHMPIADVEKSINNCIAKYYEFNEYNTKGAPQPNFYAPIWVNCFGRSAERYEIRQRPKDAGMPVCD